MLAPLLREVGLDLGAHLVLDLGREPVLEEVHAPDRLERLLVDGRAAVREPHEPVLLRDGHAVLVLGALLEGDLPQLLVGLHAVAHEVVHLVLVEQGVLDLGRARDGVHLLDGQRQARRLVEVRALPPGLVVVVRRVRHGLRLLDLHGRHRVERAGAAARRSCGAGGRERVGAESDGRRDGDGALLALVFTESPLLRCRSMLGEVAF